MLKSHRRIRYYLKYQRYFKKVVCPGFAVVLKEVLSVANFLNSGIVNGDYSLL